MTALQLPSSPTPFALPSLTGEIERLAERLRLYTVRISTQGARVGGVGAGIVWPTTTGTIIVTNAHVVPPRRGGLTVEGASGLGAEARVVGRDPDRDLAALSVVGPSNDWPAPTAIGDARQLRVGEIVVALGHPLGVGGALSVGVVHAVPNGDDELLRADIRLLPGNSGGPLATLDGAVVGVNCMVARGLGIAIPARIVEQFVREVTAN